VRTTTLAVLSLLALGALPSATRGAAPGALEAWMLGPFERHGAPVLGPRKEAVFRCPVRNADVRWEEKDVFNPAAVVREGKVHLLYRAEDAVGRFAGTSRIGLATSADGISFERRPEPVLFPDDDFMMPYEWEGGCEDPRVVEREDGTYVMTYTAFDGTTARLAVARLRISPWISARERCCSPLPQRSQHRPSMGNSKWQWLASATCTTWLDPVAAA